MKAKNSLSIISALLILLFVYAASSKLMDVPKFRVQMQHQVFSNTFAELLTWAIPFSELTIAAFLLSGKLQTMGFYASALLMGLFTTYVALVIFHYFPNVPCSCGGVLSSLGWTSHLFLNSIFLLLSFIAIYLTNRERRRKGEKDT